MSRTLKALVLSLFSIICGPALTAPQWIAHTSIAGPDQTPDGMSRFDELFVDRTGHHQIPYPFAELETFLETKIENGDNNGVRQVFIPIGRSLQRNAPAPDFFPFPRAVIALQGEPVFDEMVLEYRLFIAHQPGTDTLEVISYNDIAGRFEFQVVDNYAADQQPRVRQANRQMCLSCHQNAAPIFAMRPWSETTFNVEVASRLVKTLPDQFNSLIGTLTADAGAIDLLAERANYLSAAQLIWQQGCSSAACRMAVLRAILQYRLSGNSNFARTNTDYRRHYMDELDRNWQAKWPDGLALANSRIVDRNPFSKTPMTRSEDALSLRQPHATWREADKIVADGIVLRLAGFLTQNDIRRLDQHLLQISRTESLSLERFETQCRLANASESNRLLQCSSEVGTTKLRATIELDYHQGMVQSMHILSLQVPGDPSILQPVASALQHLSDGVQVELVNPDRNLSMRLGNGDRLASLRLYWQDPSLRQQVRLQVSVSHEFERIEQALDKMQRDHQNSIASSLAAKPFQRRLVVDELARALKLEFRVGKITEAPSSIDKIRFGKPTPDFAEQSGISGLALLQPYCGHCHSSDTLTPPGFLSGADPLGQISQCAERILARLSAWHDAGTYAISPMPPVATIGPDWAHSHDYDRLTVALQELIGRQPASTGDEQRTQADYDLLPECVVSD